MSRIRIWLDNLCRQLDISRAPNNMVIEMPIDGRAFMEELSKEHWLMCWGKDKEGFDGVVIKYNGRKFFFLESKIEY